MRSAIKSLSGVNYFSSPCIRADVAISKIADVVNGYSYDPNHVGAASTGVIFRGVNSWDILNTNRDVPVAETQEVLPLGIAEHIFYFAAFLDAEAAAAAAFKTIESRYLCAAGKVAGSLANFVPFAKPKILWGYRYGNVWYVGKCPNYYCPLIAAAGADILTRSDGLTSLTDEQFSVLAKDATHFVYTGSDWDTVFKPLVTSGAGPLGALIQAIPAVQNKQVFDILGSGSSQWFDTRPVAPDAVLQDLLLAFNPNYAVTKTAVFIRNVFMQTAGELAPISACTAEVRAAPLKFASDACTVTVATPFSISQETAAMIGGVIGGACFIAIAAFAAKTLFGGAAGLVAAKTVATGAVAASATAVQATVAIRAVPDAAAAAAVAISV